MKNLSIIFLLIAVLLAFGSCSVDTGSPTSNNNEQSVVLPPDGGNNEYIVIVDSKGKRFETNIRNKRLEDGTTIMQLINDCINNARNHGDFVSCMAHLTNNLMKRGLITNKEKGILMNIAARADIP
ncbi:MAG: hypothetical protein N2517_05820 [Ignavibacteria bacterium]|nr:hypothetical protein [Ignavibacteria bacterium]